MKFGIAGCENCENRSNFYKKKRFLRSLPLATMTMSLKAILLLVLSTLVCANLHSQRGTMDASNCSVQEYYCDTSLEMSTTCLTLKRLCLYHTIWNFKSHVLPEKTHYEYVFVSVGSDPSGFISSNALKIDTLFYSGVTRKKNIELKNANLHCLILEIDKVKFHGAKPRVTTISNVVIKKIGFFGVYINLKTAKELLKIAELNEIGIRERYIRPRAIKLLKENGINVLILPEGPTSYP